MIAEPPASAALTFRRSTPDAANYLLCALACFARRRIRQAGCLGRFEEFVLLALVRLRTNAYGVTIRRELAERTGKEISIGATF